MEMSLIFQIIIFYLKLYPNKPILFPKVSEKKKNLFDLSLHNQENINASIVAHTYLTRTSMKKSDTKKHRSANRNS